MVPYTDRKSISSENTFEKDVTDADYLETFVVSLIEQLAFKMRKENFLTSCVFIKMRFSNFETVSKQVSLDYTASDNVLIGKAKTLLASINPDKRAVRLIGVGFSNLIHGQQQIDLFNDTENNIKLYQALDAINKKFGNKTVHRAKTINTGNREFNPFNGREIQ